jgi:hypothetical protein
MKNKPVVKPSVDKPVYTYFSVCCNARAEKPPCFNPHDMTAAKEGTLGSWRCASCRKPCTCTRVKNGLDKAVVTG